MSAQRPPTLAAHPWHGVSLGDHAPELVTCYIEIVPTDTVKYELDKASGILKVDRPQKFSNVAPSLYGFLPRTYCAEDLAARCMERTGKTGIVGDGDPLDVCVLSERPIAHGGILMTARPIGGLRMVDKAQADDKIVAVLEGDAAWGGLREVAELPAALRARLEHYFLTYKLDPTQRKDDARQPIVEIAEVYDAAEARLVIDACRRDYARHYGA
jgi:inorganic pyrophosphatase